MSVATPNKPFSLACERARPLPCAARACVRVFTHFCIALTVCALRAVRVSVRARPQRRVLRVAGWAVVGRCGGPARSGTSVRGQWRRGRQRRRQWQRQWRRQWQRQWRRHRRLKSHAVCVAASGGTGGRERPAGGAAGLCVRACVDRPGGSREPRAARVCHGPCGAARWRHQVRVHPAHAVCGRVCAGVWLCLSVSRPVPNGKQVTGGTRAFGAVVPPSLCLRASVCVGATVYHSYVPGVGAPAAVGGAPAAAAESLCKASIRRRLAQERAQAEEFRVRGRGRGRGRARGRARGIELRASSLPPPSRPISGGPLYFIALSLRALPAARSGVHPPPPPGPTAARGKRKNTHGAHQGSARQRALSGPRPQSLLHVWPRGRDRKVRALAVWWSGGGLPARSLPHCVSCKACNYAPWQCTGGMPVVPLLYAR